MELDKLRNYYRLKPTSVEPSKLLLDPHNPRITLLLDDPAILGDGQNLASDAVQKAVYSVLQKREFELDQLVASIRSRGFINAGTQMIIEKYGDKFLVLEGNRRTAAMRYLLARPELTTPSVRESLQTIDVQEFTYLGNGDGFTKRDVVEMLLGQIHISGQLSWGAMERADYIYQSYCRIADIPAGKLYAFDYYRDVAQRVAESFGSSVKDVRTTLMIARNYLLLRKRSAAVTPDHYTLIDLATSTRSVKDSVFKIYPEYFHFTHEAADRFADLCIEEGRIITNPDDFRTFAKVAASGDKDFLNSVISGGMSLEEARDRLDHIADREQFEHELRRAYNILSDLPLEAYRGNQDERRLIEKLVEIVQSHLKPLLKE